MTPGSPLPPPGARAEPRPPLPPPAPGRARPIGPAGASDGDGELPAPAGASAAAGTPDRAVALERLLVDDATAFALVTRERTMVDANDPFLHLVAATRLAEVEAGTAAGDMLAALVDQLPDELFTAADGIWHGRVDHWTISGEHRLLRATATATGTAGLVALLLHDVTEADRRMTELIRRASDDPLTGLADRRQAIVGLARAVRSARRRSEHVTTIVVGLDRIAEFDDAVGHRAGDHLRSSIARRLLRVTSPHDRVSRIGDTEFLVTTSALDGPSAALEHADVIRTALDGRIGSGGAGIGFPISVGVAVADPADLERDERATDRSPATADAGDADASTDGVDGRSDDHDDGVARRLLDDARTARRVAERDRGGRATLFSESMRAEARRRARVVSVVASRIASGSLDVSYRSIHAALSGDVVGVDVSVGLGTAPSVAPHAIDAPRLLALAEESGSVVALVDLVLERTVADLVRWRAGHPGAIPPVAHLLVPRAVVASATFADDLVATVRAAGLDPAGFALRLHPSRLPVRVVDVDRAVGALRRDGVRVETDDLGTDGTWIDGTPGIDVLRLDGVGDLDLRVVRALVHLAHALGIAVVADLDEVERLPDLRATGCDMVTSPSAPGRAGSLDAATATALG